MSSSPIKPLVILSVVYLAACSSQSLRVQSDPGGARMTVVDAADKVVAESEADDLVRPVEFNVDFKRSPQYRVTARPQEAMSETHEVTEVVVTQQDYMKLEPDAAKSTRRDLLIALDEKEYGYLDEFHLVVDSRGRWRGLRARSRAYESLAEEGGVPPVRLVDLGPELTVQGLDISPDGDHMVYSRAEFSKVAIDQVASAIVDPLANINACNIRGVKIGGGGIQQITSGNHRDMYPSFAEKGDKLLFASNRRRRQSADLLLIDTSGRGGISNVYVDSRGLMVTHPSQASDGTIVFCLIDPDSLKSPYIWTIGGDNKFPTQIVQGSQPRVSPDGSHITYIGTDDNLWVVNIDGSSQTQLTSDADPIRTRFIDTLNPKEKQVIEWAEDNGNKIVHPYASPSWSPDGKLILFASMESADNTGRPNQDIWIMDVDGSGKRQLTTNGSADQSPLMSPDGKHIYFISNRGKQWGIYRIEAPQGD